MTKSFEEFLKAEEVSAEVSCGVYAPAIPFKELGNWAWNALVYQRDLTPCLLGDIITDWGNLKMSDEEAPIETLLIHIVIACLGKQEIEKRLKVLVE